MNGRQEKLNLVRFILQSEKFHSQSLQEKQQVLNQIIATGEVSREDVLALINEEQQKQPSIQTSNQFSYLERVPYDVFVKIIDSGQIKGRDLVALCNSSPTLRNYCLKDRQHIDKNGRIYKTETQYVYRKLLNDMGVHFEENEIPSEIYAKVSGGYQLWDYIAVKSYYSDADYQNMLNSGFSNLSQRYKIEYVFAKIEGMNNCKQVIRRRDFTLILTIGGKVWIYDPNDISIPARNIPNLNNIVQISATDIYGAALDFEGNVWVCVVDYFSPLSTEINLGFSFGEGKINQKQNSLLQISARKPFIKLDLDPKIGKIKFVSVGKSLSLINDKEKLYIVNAKGKFLSQLGNVKYINEKVDGRTYISTATIFRDNTVTIVTIEPRFNRIFIFDENLKKAMSTSDSAVVLTESGRLYILDIIMRLQVGQEFQQLSPPEVKIEDFDLGDPLGYAVDSRRNLYKFRTTSTLRLSMMPEGTPQYGVLELEPKINQVVGLSVSLSGFLSVLRLNE